MLKSEGKSRKSEVNSRLSFISGGTNMDYQLSKAFYIRLDIVNLQDLTAP